MTEFISTHTRILISLWAQEMPALQKYIMKYSTPGTKKKKIDIEAMPSLLEKDQIHDALAHASDIIQQALKTTKQLQDGLNTVNSKRDALLKHRSAIESALTNLATINQQNA